MSVQTELDRLNTAKSNLKTAIEGKGVAVSDDTKLDGYSTLVEQIGGGDSNVVVVDIPELNGNNAQVTLTDEQLSLIFSENKIVYINSGAGLIPFIGKISNDALLFGMLYNNVIADNSTFFNISIIVMRDLKKAGMQTVSIQHLPNASDSDNGKFLQVIGGTPTWSTLPIYTGEVE